MSELEIIPDNGHLPVVSKSLIDDVKEFFLNSAAPNSRKAYESCWKTFIEWCALSETSPLPVSPEALALYLAWLAQGAKDIEYLESKGCSKRFLSVAKKRPKSWATINLHLTTIVMFHKYRDMPNPAEKNVVRSTLNGISRTIGTRQNRKNPILKEQLSGSLRGLGSGLNKYQRKAVLLMGWSGALRRSEIAALNVKDVSFSAEGMVITRYKSKTNQTGEEEKIGIPYAKNKDICPVEAVKKWIEVSGIAGGAMFRVIKKNFATKERMSDKAVARLVKRTADYLGLDPKLFSGHSLRSGFVTETAKADVPLWKIMRQTRHKSLTMLQRYIREGDVFKDNPLNGIL